MSDYINQLNAEALFPQDDFYDTGYEPTSSPLENSFYQALDLNNPNAFSTNFGLGTNSGNVNNNIGFITPGLGAQQLPTDSPTPLTASQANPNSFGDFFGSFGASISRLVNNAVGAVGQNMANQIARNPTYNGQSTRPTTQNAGTFLGMSTGTLLLVGGGILVVVLLLRK